MVARYDRPMQSSRPLLVIVTGAPGSGKSTLAERLAADLGLMLLSKDSIKEALGDALGAPEDVPASQRLGIAAYAAMFALAGQLLASGRGAIVESNFSRGLAEPDLTDLVEQSDARMIHCAAAPKLVVRRYRERHERGERHRVHLDPDRLADLEAAMRLGSFEPPLLDVPQLVVTTDHGYDPGYEAIRAFIGAVPAIAR